MWFGIDRKSAFIQYKIPMLYSSSQRSFISVHVTGSIAGIVSRK